VPYAETGAGKLFYTTSRRPADSPSLLLVHGAGGTRLNWPAELRRLPGAVVYTLDLPGHGRSEGNGRDSVAAYGEAILAFLDQVGIEQAVVTGHSMGGAIAQTLALGFPDRVAGLVLVATGARLRVAPAILEGIHADFERVADLITRIAWSPEADPAMVELGRQTLLSETSPDVLFGDFTACNRFDVMKRLHEIETPTLVVAGTADQLTPLKYARFLAEHITGARLTVIKGAGHMVMLERPAEVAKTVGDFLETGFCTRNNARTARR